jgi:transcriptional regulator with XRE-family HTH domain
MKRAPPPCERIAAAMQRCHMTQGELARALGISQPACSMILSGKRTGRKHYEKMEKVFASAPASAAWIETGRNPPPWATRLGFEDTISAIIAKTSADHSQAAQVDARTMAYSAKGAAIDIKLRLPEILLIYRAVAMAANDATEQSELRTEYMGILALLAHRHAFSPDRKTTAEMVDEASQALNESAIAYAKAFNAKSTRRASLSFPHKNED